MGLISNMTGKIKNMFKINADAGKAFGVELIWSDDMANAIRRWDLISKGKPPWLSAEDQIGTINMAKHIADTRAKLVTLDIGIGVSGSPLADYLQAQADILLKRLPDMVASAERLGGVVVKFNGQSWDFVMPGAFGITAQDDNGNITGAIFAESAVIGNSLYTRLEYHRFNDNGLYLVSNKAFKNNVSAATLGTEVELARVPQWSEFEKDVIIENLQRPLFGFFRLPGSNIIDQSSPLGMSAFAGAIPELKAIDVAISRKNMEVEDSKHITFVGQQLVKNATSKGIRLPRFVKGLGIGLNDTETKAIAEHVPTMLTEARIKDINFDLSMAGVKCGFSEGVFVLDGQTGMVTATQVEADDRDTIQTIKADRDALKTALEQAIDGAAALAVLSGFAPMGDYELTFNFGDITYSYDEDKAAWRNYVLNGWVPKWIYFTKFEGMTEEDAKALTKEAAQAAEPELFA